MQKLAIIAENKVVQLVRGVSTISAHGRKRLAAPAVKQSMAGMGPLISYRANPLWGLANHCISMPWLPHLRILPPRLLFLSLANNAVLYILH